MLTTGMLAVYLKYYSIVLVVDRGGISASLCVFVKSIERRCKRKSDERISKKKRCK